MADQPLTGKSIAITRPIDQAQKLATLIENHGGHAIYFPLIAISALADDRAFRATIQAIADYDWAIFISSNAVEHGLSALIAQTGVPAHLQFAAIGPVTAKALQDRGIKQVLTPKNRFDSESLLALPEMQAVNHKKIMLFRGIGGRELLADTLKTRGAEVTFAECYQRINPQTNCQLLTQYWHNQKLHGLVVTSSEAMRHLLDLAEATPWLKEVTLFVNHARIAEQPLAMGLRIKIATAPGDAAMLACLQADCP